MSQPQFRRVARLEREMQTYRRQKDKSRLPLSEMMRRDALTCVGTLCMLVLHGNPKIDEPLRAAWRRCIESGAWKLCRESHPDFGEYNTDTEGDPCRAVGAKWIADYFKKYFLPDLPGADQTEKLNRVLEMAPPWLLWFTFMDAHGSRVGLKVPDISSMMRFARGTMTMDHLPTGPFEHKPLPPGTHDYFYDEPKLIVLPSNLTTRERARAIRIYEKLGRRVAKE